MRGRNPRFERNEICPKLNKPDSLQIARGAFTSHNTLQNPLSETSLNILTRSNGVFSSLVPKAEHYWDVWDDVLSNAETDCGGVLHQDGDLWIVWSQNAIDAINELCESQLEYETSHRDAGDGYAHLVGGLVRSKDLRYAETSIGNLTWEATLS